MIRSATRLLTVPAAVIAATLLCADVSAQGRQGRGRQGGRSGVEASVLVVFREGDRATFREYFAAHAIGAKALPPGIARNVVRGKPLPPGIAKRSLPADLLAVGPKVDDDVSFAIVGDVVVALKGGVVIDILAGVFGQRDRSSKAGPHGASLSAPRRS